MIDVLLACSPDRIIPEPVMSSILMQDVPVTVFICHHEGGGAWKARNYLQDVWENLPNRNDDTGLVLTMDNDIVLPQGSLAKLVKFLNQHDDFGAIGISKQYSPIREVDEKVHIDAAPVLYRNEVYGRLRYSTTHSCECLQMTKDVRSMGYRMGFIGGLKCQHIEETRVNYGQ